MLETQHIQIPEDQTTLVDLVKTLEAEQFPEFAGKPGFQSPRTGLKYMAPSTLVEKGAVTPGDIEHLASDSGSKMLSVGAGPGYLERLLLKFGINPDQIVVADKDPTDLPQELPRREFDMTKPWPADLSSGGAYCLIVFPESRQFGDQQELEALRASMEAEDPDVMIEDKDVYRELYLRGMYRLIAHALPHLDPSGKITITGVPLGPLMLFEVRNRLLSHGHDISMEADGCEIEPGSTQPPSRTSYTVVIRRAE
jgi:hypothetical protein